MRALALAVAFLATTAQADGLVDNVNGYTLDAKGEVERFTGILIDGRGKVAKLLDRGDKRPEKLDFKLDAKGRTLIPGLIDAHGHVTALGFHALQLDLSDTRTLAEAQAKLAHWSADHPSPRWIVGRGWDEARWALGRAPTAADIDAAVADRPVWLARADGRAGLANSAALAIAKAPGDRGLFVGEAMALVTRMIPPPLPRERDAAVAKAQELLLASGITATTDMGTTADDWNSFRRFGDARGLRVRVISYVAGIDPLLSIAGGGPTPWLYDGRLRMVGVHLQADGTTKRSAQFDDDARLRNLMSRAAMDGFQVALRAIGADGNRQSLDAIEELALTYKGDRRWRIEHGQMIDSTDQPRLARNGVIASLVGSHPAARPNLLSGIADAASLAALTSDAARATFADDRIGMLAPGMNADFLLLDRDIFAAAPADAARVMETWVGGVRAWIRK